MFDGAHILITGGTGSLGRALLRRLRSGRDGSPSRIVIYSRDEAKQYAMRTALAHRPSATEDVAFDPALRDVTFEIGDVRDRDRLSAALTGIDIVFHTAAMKQVPTCEYAPTEAAATNVTGTHNLVSAIAATHPSVRTVVGVSTDKACEPINVMGMTKAVQERILVGANLTCETRFVSVRYGNVVASRGSVLPLFRTQAESGGPLTLTDPAMTRFLLTLEQATQAIVDACATAARGDVIVPEIRAAKVADLAEIIAEPFGAPIVHTGIRPGEKLHETLVSSEEVHRATRATDGTIAIAPMLPDLATDRTSAPLTQAYRSDAVTMSRDELAAFLGSAEAEAEDPLGVG